MCLDIGHTWGSYFIFYSYFSGRCNVWQFHATWKTANREGISGAGGGVTSMHIEFLDDSNHSTMCNAKGPVHKKDILILLESGQDAGRSKWYPCISLMDGGPSIWSSVQFHIDGMGVSPIWQSYGCQILLLILHLGPIFGMSVQQALCLWLGWWRWLIGASFHGWLAALPAMVPDGLRCDWGAAKALLAHQA